MSLLEQHEETSVSELVSSWSVSVSRKAAKEVGKYEFFSFTLNEETVCKVRVRHAVPIARRWDASGTIIRKHWSEYRAIVMFKQNQRVHVVRFKKHFTGNSIGIFLV
jgi:hypothetical protein